MIQTTTNSGFSTGFEVIRNWELSSNQPTNELQNISPKEKKSVNKVYLKSFSLGHVHKDIHRTFYKKSINLASEILKNYAGTIKENYQWKNRIAEKLEIKENWEILGKGTCLGNSVAVAFYIKKNNQFLRPENFVPLERTEKFIEIAQAIQTVNNVVYSINYDHLDVISKNINRKNERLNRMELTLEEYQNSESKTEIDELLSYPITDEALNSIFLKSFLEKNIIERQQIIIDLIIQSNKEIIEVDLNFIAKAKILEDCFCDGTIYQSKNIYQLFEQYFEKMKVSSFEGIILISGLLKPDVKGKKKSHAMLAQIGKNYLLYDNNVGVFECDDIKTFSKLLEDHLEQQGYEECRFLFSPI
ncbi:MAG: hypothetical protein Tsb0021_15310 [Chlamydiales bacterium]